MMNKQIQELFIRAGGAIDTEDGTGAFLTYTDYLDPEKFAELIIKECVGICAKENWKTLGEDTKGMKQFERGLLMGRKIMSKDLCDKIEERFGL